MSTRKARPESYNFSEIKRVIWVGFWLNAFLSIFKIAAGIAGNSRAVVADGIHSLSDLVTNVVVLVGVHFWVAPPDAAHPYGHKRLEALITVVIGLVLAFVGIGIALDAIQRIHAPSEQEVGGLLALSAALSSVIIKEWLFRWTLKKGRELKSSAVEATAWEHRSDALSSVPIVITVAAVTWFPSLGVLDLIGALIVAGFIEHAAWKIYIPALNTLLDKGADAATNERILSFVMEIPDVKGAHALRSRYLGQDLIVDLHISVEGSLTVEEGNILAHRVEDALCSEAACEKIGVEISDVVIHVDPWRVPPPDAD